jgi:hypothetical protein
MEHETTTWNGEPAIVVRLDYDEAREYLALDEFRIGVLDALTESDRKDLVLAIFLYPLREFVDSTFGERAVAIGDDTSIWFEDDYDEALFALEGIDRAAYLEVLDRAARIIAREVRAWDTEDVARLVELLTKLDETADRADRRAEDYVRMDALPSAPIPEGVDAGYPVWAVDKHGQALVGEGADEVESIEEVRAWYEEHARRMKGIPLRCHKCGHSWLYRGGSQHRTTCPACHITVYLDKCEISHGDLRGAALDR